MPRYRYGSTCTTKQCVGVAIEGIDIWYMGLIIRPLYIQNIILYSENMMLSLSFINESQIADNTRKGHYHAQILLLIRITVLFNEIL